MGDDDTHVNEVLRNLHTKHTQRNPPAREEVKIKNNFANEIGVFLTLDSSPDVYFKEVIPHLETNFIRENDERGNGELVGDYTRLMTIERHSIH